MLIRARNRLETEKIVAGFSLVFLVSSLILAGILMIDTYYGDPTIYLVYSRNIANGDLFSFNPGKFSSGSTSPLWALILSVGFLTTNGVLAAKLISAASTLTALIIAF